MKMSKGTKADRHACLATIAICTYNRIATLRKTLKAVRRLRGRFIYEIIVVNGPSTDGTSEFLRDETDIRIFDNSDLNLSVSRNIAIANSHGKYISFIDDDAIPEAEWLDRIIDKLESDETISALGGFIRDSNGITFQAKYVFADVWGQGYPSDNYDYSEFLSRDRKLYLSLTGTNVTFRKDALISIGGFDEAFAYFLDETDVNKRMVDAGMRSEVLPGAEIHHKYAPSHLRSERRIATNMYPIARSIAYFALRHGAPELGWWAASKRIQEFYLKELEWKSDTVRHGGMSISDFHQIMEQILRGIIDGISYYFDHPAAASQDRLKKHFVPGSPSILTMRRSDETLRLCLLSQDHGRRRPAGIGMWTNLAAKGLAERGHEVTVIGEVEHNGALEFADFTEDNFWSHNVSNSYAQAALEVDCLGLPPVLADTSKRKLSEIHRIYDQRKFEVISSPIWDVEGAAVIGTGLPSVLSLHTCVGLMIDVKPEWKKNKDYFENHVLRVVNAEIQALKRADFILANSKSIISDISSVYGLNLFDRPHLVVPHGVRDIDNHDTLLDQRRGKTLKNILFLGRLERRKGASHMAEVMNELLSLRQDVVINIVGQRVDDDEAASVSALVENFPDRAVYHGFLDDEDVDKLMRETDIFFSPSIYESFGLIYAEAMRYSIPSVAYEVGGVKEVVSHGKTGLLAPLNDKKCLLESLLKLVDDDGMLLRMSAAARKSFETYFDYTIMAERLEAAFRLARQVRDN